MYKHSYKKEEDPLKHPNHVCAVCNHAPHFISLMMKILVNMNDLINANITNNMRGLKPSELIKWTLRDMKWMKRIDRGQRWGTVDKDVRPPPVEAGASDECTICVFCAGKLLRPYHQGEDEEVRAQRLKAYPTIGPRRFLVNDDSEANSMKPTPLWRSWNRNSAIQGKELSLIHI